MISSIAKEIVGESPFKIGDVVKHESGRTVKIVDGQFWGEYGISNFWEWREVKKNGELGKLESGYGSELCQ